MGGGILRCDICLIAGLVPDFWELCVCVCVLCKGFFWSLMHHIFFFAFLTRVSGVKKLTGLSLYIFYSNGNSFVFQNLGYDRAANMSNSLHSSGKVFCKVKSISPTPNSKNHFFIISKQERDVSK